MIALPYVASGLGVGLLVGMTGVGGGSLMTPILVLLFAIHPQTAVGTDLLYASVTKGVGTAVHGIERNVDWRVVGLLSSGSLPACALTVFVISRFPAANRFESQTISIVLGAALLATAVCVLFRSQITSFARSRGEMRPGVRRCLTVAMGLTLGVLVTISSVGAGAIGVTALILLYPRLSAAEIVGSDVAHAAPLTLAAGFGHLALGSINGSVLLSLLVGSIPGVVLGSIGASRAPESILRPALAAVLVVAGVRLVFS